MKKLLEIETETEMTELLSVLPVACAQVSGVRTGPAFQVARGTVAGGRGVRVRPFTGTAQLSQVHQAHQRAGQTLVKVDPATAQAVVARAGVAQARHLTDSYGTNGTTGSWAKGTLMGMTPIDGVSGAPPRGRPV